jgi:hypothetical protein
LLVEAGSTAGGAADAELGAASVALAATGAAEGTGTALADGASFTKVVSAEGARLGRSRKNPTQAATTTASTTAARLVREPVAS